MAQGSRRKFSAQFKDEAVQMVINSDRPITQTAKDLDINPGTLGNWVNKYRADHPEPDQPLSAVDRVRLRELEHQTRELKRENEFLKKAAAFFARQQLDEKSALIEAEKVTYPIAWMCKQLDVPRSSFYAWRDRVGTITQTQARRDALVVEIHRLFTYFRKVAGCRRITVELNKQGFPCSVGLVAALMRQEGLAAIQPRAYKRTTVSDDQAQIFDDHLNRDFDPDHYEPGQAVVSDITYLRTSEGWLYLATVLDLATRMIVGWQLADHMRASLVQDALPSNVSTAVRASGASKASTSLSTSASRSATSGRAWVWCTPCGASTGLLVAPRCYTPSDSEQ